MPTRVKRKDDLLGKTGRACLAFSILFLTTGLSYVIDEPPAILINNLKILFSYLDYEVWGYFWTTAGALFLAATFWKRLQLWAFLLGCTVTSFWAVGYLVEAVFGSSYRGYVSAVVNGVFTYFIFLVATWEEPLEVEVEEEDTGGRS